ncbi:hypothetical protein EYZ11_010746 [Aspergillus tanneri]|uniref:Pleckstrin homology domain-containing protein n=1 Tax=Aspergillus tanneri TaxID=1220188 RepID=A0A4S3J4V3_9EURO|nr:uncharacterized protein ATNIH1004_001217 [Aspergillus tanneri]KAA8652313.1 hypothetical protein ATNIH1004_001217 [Aspergillus tanneri]THC89795.1 hypothetical protein EYZ11_010746 [Aspergillus tanneri]
MATDITPQSPPSKAFPTPSATPQTTPSMHARDDSSPGASSSPTSLPFQNFSPNGRFDFDDVADEDTLSPLDPRRFTPTLHASLVSEILSLRREAESKTRAIDMLERTLDESRTENENIAVRLSQSNKENRSLRHQLQSLEGGTSSALTELTRERDEVQDSISDVRKKLEQAQKRIRSREEEIERTQKLWEREKQSWESERRNLERKVHVVEGRLRVVVDEVAAAQAAGPFDVDSGANDTAKEGTGKESDSASVRSGSSQGLRRTSVTSLSTNEDDFHNVRYSVASVANSPGSESEGLNLAQELAFDEDEEFGSLDNDLVPDSPEALPEERPMSVQSHLSHTIGMGAKARKILGLSLHSNPGGQVTRDDGASEPSSPWKSPVSLMYRDTGIQYSPPASPKLAVTKGLLLSRHAEENAGNRNCNPRSIKDSSTSTISADMVSASCQTVEYLPTPPLTPKIDESSPPPQEPETVLVASVSVQTEQLTDVRPDSERVSLPPNNGSASPDLAIPMIAIHPPCSNPPSPRGSVVLPPQTKSVSCQVDIKPAVKTQTVGTQTEGIRIDQRPVKLPARLLPSAIQDLPLRAGTADVPIQAYHAPLARTKPPSSVQEKWPKPLPSNKIQSHVQAYPGNNDNGPLSEDLRTDLRRPFRSSSLFAGFEQLSDDDGPRESEDIFTDDALLNRPFASYTLKRGKLVSTKERPSLDEPTLPDLSEHLLDPDSHLLDASIENRPKDRDLAGSSQPGPRPGATSSGIRQQDIRRAAMISSGAAAHQKIRPRSPSEPSLDSGSASRASSITPPFPVPIRLSSRKFPRCGSDGRQSPTPPNFRKYSDGRPQIIRRPTLRRVRSAAAMAPSEHHRPGSLSSPMSGSSYGPDSPQHQPPLPFDDITAPRDRQASQRRSTRRAGPPRSLLHERQDSTATSVQPTSVVDAIAQTMVGEWMLKYVRRKSFGVGESKDNWDGRNAEEVSANITNSGMRHKRWVWLAPYERAVMWSSKQPTSGPALLGKSGRKLIIQSVLDVKDDTPFPKGFNSQNQFNRSILILTPKRALKFTAMSVERHYVWLTALSFLSHSATGLHDLAALPPVPQEEITSPASTATLRRNPIRDSIRIAKGRPRPGPMGKRSLNQPEPVPELPTSLEPTNSMDAADPPTVPRFSNHSRKRSNTNPRMPAIRSFSSQGTMPSIPSTRGSDANGPTSHGPATINSGRSSYSRRTSEASTGTGNFFDAIGTVRMEAFIDQTESNRIRNTRAWHGSKASSPWGVGSQGYHEPEYPTYEDGEHFHHDDPFRGF